MVSYHGTDVDMVCNGETLPTIHVGTTTIDISPSSIQLNNGLLDPNIMKDLLSVSKPTSNYPLTFEFIDLGFVMKDKVTDRTMEKDKKWKGLYITFDAKHTNHIFT